MFYNYLKSAWRSVLRFKFFSFINIIGLATGLASCMLILQYVQFEWSYEDHNPKADRVVRLSVGVYDGEDVLTEDVECYPGVGPLLKTEIPEVVEFVRMRGMESREFRYEGKAFLESLVYAGDSSCFNVLNFELIEGDELTALTAPFEIVISERLALKIFGSTSVVGKSLTSPVGDQNITLNIVGVMKNSPANTHLKAEVIVSFITGVKYFDWDENNWNQNNEYTYVLLDQSSSYANFLQKLEGVNQRLETQELLEDEKLHAEMISDIHLYSHKTFEPEANGDARTVSFLGIIAIVIILIACVNYVNMTTAKAMERAKEVGIRKVIGSSKFQLWAQFMTETIVINLLASLIAVGIIFLSLPFFRQLSGIPSTITIWNHATFWISLGGLTTLSIFLSGIYPAFILSSFQPIVTLKGKFSRSHHGQWLRKALVVFQFSMAIIMVGGTFVVNQQVRHMLKKDLGLDQEQVLVVRAPFSDSLKNRADLFRDRLMSYPDIKNVAFSSSVPGLSINEISSATGISLVGELNEVNHTYYLYSIDEQFIPLMDMELIEGSRNFRKEEHQFTEGEFQLPYVIVNEEATRLWNFSDPKDAIGKQLDMFGKTPTIVGVLKNFHQISVKEAHIPMILVPPIFGWDLASIRIESQDMLATMEKIEKEWSNNFASGPFEYFFLDEQYDQLYTSDKHFFQIFSLLTLLAIIIACLGLFGLATFTILQRTKEIGIRKVLGATVSQILVLLSKGFLQPLAISVAIAIPTSYILLSYWLESYAYKIELRWWILIFPALLLIIIACLSISVQTIKAAKVNPIESLRQE